MVLQAAAACSCSASTSCRCPSLLARPAPSRCVAGAPVGADRVILFAIGAVSTAALWAVYRYTGVRPGDQRGRRERAGGSEPRPLARPDRDDQLGASVPGSPRCAGAFIAPITFLQPTQLVVAGRSRRSRSGSSRTSRSFPLVFAAALGLGVVESLMARYVTAPGLSQSVPFVIVILMLVVRGRGLPLRSHVLDRLPQVGLGRIRPVPVAVTFVLLVVRADPVPVHAAGRTRSPSPWVSPSCACRSC